MSELSRRPRVSQTDLANGFLIEGERTANPEATEQAVLDMKIFAGLADGAFAGRARATFDPSGNTLHRTVAPHGLGVFLPNKAIITKAWFQVVTTFTSPTTDDATIAVKVEGTGDIVAAIAIDDASNIWDAGIHAGLPGYPSLGADAAHDTQPEVAALFAATFVKTTAVREVTATVAVEALTAGKAIFFFEWSMGA